MKQKSQLYEDISLNSLISQCFNCIVITNNEYCIILNFKHRFALFLILQVTHMLKVRQPYFSNLIEQDSGVVTAGMIDTRHSSNISEEDAKTDLYKPVFKFEDVKELMSKGVEEYNKIHPRIKLALYKVGRWIFFSLHQILSISIDMICFAYDLNFFLKLFFNALLILRMKFM